MRGIERRIVELEESLQSRQAKSVLWLEEDSMEPGTYWVGALSEGQRNKVTQDEIERLQEDHFIIILACALND